MYYTRKKDFRSVIRFARFPLYFTRDSQLWLSVWGQHSKIVGGLHIIRNKAKDTFKSKGIILKEFKILNLSKYITPQNCQFADD